MDKRKARQKDSSSSLDLSRSSERKPTKKLKLSVRIKAGSGGRCEGNMTMGEDSLILRHSDDSTTTMDTLSSSAEAILLQTTTDEDESKGRICRSMKYE